jgi:hypothetical protein
LYEQKENFAEQHGLRKRFSSNPHEGLGESSFTGRDFFMVAGSNMGPGSDLHADIVITQNVSVTGQI